MKSDEPITAEQIVRNLSNGSDEAFDAETRIELPAGELIALLKTRETDAKRAGMIEASAIAWNQQTGNPASLSHYKRCRDAIESAAQSLGGEKL